VLRVFLKRSFVPGLGLTALNLPMVDLMRF